MGISIPPRLEWLLLVVSGEKWPRSDEVRADQLAETVRRAADRVDEAVPLLAQGVQRLGEGASGGRTEEAVRKRLRKGPALLHDAAVALRNQASAIKQLAVQIQYVKMMIFGALVMLLVELLTAIAFPTVANWLRFLTRAALVSRLMKLLLVRLALSLLVAAAVGTGLQVIMDLAIQLAQIHRGDRVSLDWNQIRTSAWIGALGGGLGFGLGLVAAPAFQALAKRFAKNVGEEVAEGAARNLPPSPTPPPPSRGPVPPPPGHGSAEFASELFVEAGAEFLTEGTASAITEGEFKANGAAVSSGAISGVAEGGGGRIGDRLAGNREPTPDVPEPSTSVDPALGTPPPPDTPTTPPGTTPETTTTLPGPPPSDTESPSGTAPPNLTTTRSSDAPPPDTTVVSGPVGSPPVADGTRPPAFPGERSPGSGPGSAGDTRPAPGRELPTRTGNPATTPAETAPTAVGQPGGPPLTLSIPDPVLHPTPGDTSPVSATSAPTSSDGSTPASSVTSTPGTTPPPSPIDESAVTKHVADPGSTGPVVSTGTPGPNPTVTTTGNTASGTPTSPGPTSPTTPTVTTPQPVTPPTPSPQATSPQPIGSQPSSPQPVPQSNAPQPAGSQSGAAQPGSQGNAPQPVGPQPVGPQPGSTQPVPQSNAPQPVGSQPVGSQSGATQPGSQGNASQPGTTQLPGTQSSGRQIPTSVAGVPTVGTSQLGGPQPTPQGAVEQSEAQRPAAQPRPVPPPATVTPEPVRTTGSTGTTPTSAAVRPADLGAKDGGDVRGQLPELLASYFDGKGPETIDTGSVVRDAELAMWRVTTVVASLENTATTKADLDLRLAQVTEHVKSTERAVREFAQVERAAGFTVPASVMHDPDFLSFAFRQEALQLSAVSAEKVAARREKLNQAYVSRLVRRRDAARELARLKYSGHVQARDAYRQAADRAAELAPLDRAISGNWVDRAARDRFTRQWIAAGDGHRRLLQRQVGGERVRDTSPAAVHLEAEEADLRRLALAEQLVGELVAARRRLGDTAEPPPHPGDPRPGPDLASIPEGDETDAAPTDATGPTVTGFASGGGGSIGLPSGAGFIPPPSPMPSTSGSAGRPGFGSQAGGFASVTSALTSDAGGVPPDPNAIGGAGQAGAKPLRPLDFGIPERLAGIPELHRALRRVLPPETGLPSLTEFEQVLRIGYPKASRDGVLLTYGSDEHAREIVISLVRSNPRLVPGPPTRGHQVVTGTHDGEWADTSRSMQSSNSMTLSVPVGTGLGTDAVLRTVTVTPSVTFGANSRSVTATSDNTAFVSQVSDNRGPSSLVTWDLEWQATVTRADETGRDVSLDLAPVAVADGLTLWTPQYYVNNTDAEEFVRTNTRGTLPRNFMVERYAGNEALFATALQLIGDRNAPVGSKTRAVLRRFFDAANQSSLLATATGTRGAELVLTGPDGLVVGVLRQRTELSGWKRVGTGTFHGLLEDVHVDAVKAAGSSELGQDTATALAVQGGLFITDEFGVGPKVGVRQGRTVKDGLSAGGIGLGVTVGRFAGQSLGYEARTTSILRYEPLVAGNRAKVSPPVPGGVQVRLREPDAVSHGLPVERTARLRSQRADRERQRLQAGQAAGPLRHPPAMVLANRGIGLSVVEDLTGAEALLQQLYPVLEQRGYLPPRGPDGRYLAPEDKEGRRRLGRQFENLAKLTNTVSKRGLTAQFEPAMQNGIPVLLEHPDGKSGPWWRNEPRSIEVTVSLRLSPDDWTLADSSRHFHLVNLWISSDAPGGSRSVGNAREVSVGAGVLPASVAVGPIKIQLPNWTGKFKFGNSRSINSGSVVNNVELLESHDTALSYQFQYELRAEIYERGELLAGRYAPNQSVTLKLLDDVSSDVPQTLSPQPFDAPRMRPQGYRSVFQRVGYVVTDTIATSQLYDAFRQVLPPALTQEGKAAWSLARAFGNVENVRSHLEQISDGLYTTDHLFKEGWVRDDQGELQLKVNFGKPRYRNRTGPEFVSGRIHFGMDRAGNSASRSAGWENSWQLGGVEGVVPGAPGGVVSRSASFQQALAEARSTGSAVERLSLHFGRMYQFSADALFTVRGLAVRRNRFVDGSDTPRVEYVEEPDGYWFWVRESDMLRLYLEDDLDVPHHVVEEALWSDQNGPRDLPVDTVVAMLDRFADGQLTLSTDTVATVAGRYVAGDLPLSSQTITGVLRSHAARDIDLPTNLVDQLRSQVDVPAGLANALDDRALPSEWAMPQADRDARALLEGFLTDPTVLPRGAAEVPDPAAVADALDRYLAGDFPVSERALDLILDAWQHDQLDLPNDLATRVGAERPPTKSTVEQLRDHAAGRWPLSDRAVAYALDRHLSGVEPLPVALVGKLAARYAAGHLSLPDDLVGDLLDAYRDKRLRLPDTVAAGVANQFSGVPHLPLMVQLTVPEAPPHGAPQAAAAPQPAPIPTAGPTPAPSLPAHMLADGRAVLGFGAPERIELSSSLPEVIRGLLRQVAPEAVRDWSLSSALGLLRQIGDQYSTPGVRAMVDELFGSGLRLAFVNTRGHLGAELVAIKLQAGALHNPVALGVESRAGMENYAYANHTRSRTWTNSRSRTWTAKVFGSGVPGNQDPGAEHLTSAAGNLNHSRTQNRSVSTTSADTVTSARTVFDWSGNRDFGVEFTIVAEVTRSPMPGRPVNQAYTAAFQAAENTYRQVHQQRKRPARAVDTVQGAMTWRLPKALSDPAQGADGPYGIRGNPPRGRFRLPEKFYPEGFTGLDTLLDAAQRAVGRQALQEATRNGQTVAWFLGAHAVRANLDRIVDRDGYEFSGLFEPGLVAELFADLKVKGTLRDPVKLREFSTMALGHYLKREQLTKTGTAAGVSRGTNAELSTTVRTDIVDPAKPDADGGAHTAGIAAVGGLATGMSASQDAQRGTRDETHAKITGPVWLVRAELDLRLTSRKWREGLLWNTDPTVRGATESTSTVYLYLFEHDARKIFTDLENAPPRPARQLRNRYDVGAFGSLFRPHPGLRVVSDDVAQDPSAIPLRPLRTNAEAGPSTGPDVIDIAVEAPSVHESTSDDGGRHTPVIPPPPASFVPWPKPVAHSHSHGELVDIATRVGDEDWARRDTRGAAETAPPRDGDLDGRCVWLLSALRTELYRDVWQGPGGREVTFSGVRPGESADDLAVGARGARPQQQEFASSTGWARPASLQALEDAVFQAGVGATGFVHLYRRTGVGHAFALHHSPDGLRYVDPTNRKTPVATPTTRPSIVEGEGGSRDPLESDADLRALVVDATGQARPQAFEHVVESRSARALVDAPASTELGSRRRFPDTSGDDPAADSATVDTLDEAEWDHISYEDDAGRRGVAFGRPATFLDRGPAHWFVRYTSPDPPFTMVVFEELRGPGEADRALAEALAWLDAHPDQADIVVVLSGFVNVPALGELRGRPQVADVFWLGTSEGATVVASVDQAALIADVRPGGGFGRTVTDAPPARHVAAQIPEANRGSALLVFATAATPDRMTRVADVGLAALAMQRGYLPPDQPVILAAEGSPDLARRSADRWRRPVHVRSTEGWVRVVPGGQTVALGDSPSYALAVRPATRGVSIALPEQPAPAGTLFDAGHPWWPVHVQVALNHPEALSALQMALAQVESHTGADPVVVTVRGEPPSRLTLRRVGRVLDALREHAQVRAVVWHFPSVGLTAVLNDGRDLVTLRRDHQDSPSRDASTVTVRAPVTDPLVTSAVIAYADPDPERQDRRRPPVRLDWPGARPVAQEAAATWGRVVLLPPDTDPAAGSAGEPVAFWPDWRSALDQATAELASTLPYEVAVVPAGLLISHPDAPRPEGIELLRGEPDRMTVVMAPGPGARTQDVADTLTTAFDTLYADQPVMFQLLLTGPHHMAIAGAFLGRALQRPWSWALRVAAPDWTVTDGELRARHLSWSGAGRPALQLANGVQLMGREKQGRPVRPATFHAVERLTLPTDAVAYAHVTREPLAIMDAEGQWTGFAGWLSATFVERGSYEPLVLLLPEHSVDNALQVAGWLSPGFVDLANDGLTVPNGVVVAEWDAETGRAVRWIHDNHGQRREFATLSGAVEFARGTGFDLAGALHALVTGERAQVSDTVVASIAAGTAREELPRYGAGMSLGTAGSSLVVGNPAFRVSPGLFEGVLEDMADEVFDGQFPEPSPHLTVSRTHPPATVEVPTPEGSPRWEELLAVRQLLRSEVQLVPDGRSAARATVRFDRDPTWKTGDGLLSTAPHHQFVARLLRATAVVFRVPDAETSTQLDVMVKAAPIHHRMAWTPWITWDRRGYTGYFVPADLALGLHGAIPPNVAHHVVVEFGVLNADTVTFHTPDGESEHAPQTLISSAGGWRTAADYVSHLPALDAEQVPVVVLTRITSTEPPDFLLELSQHAAVLMPGQPLYADDHVAPSLAGEWRILYQGEVETQTGDLADLLPEALAELLPESDGEPTTPADAIADLAAASTDPAVAAVARGVYRDNLPPSVGRSIRVQIPDATVFQRLTAATAADFAGLDLMAVAETAESAHWAELPTRYLRRVTVDGQVFWLVDTQGVRTDYRTRLDGTSLVALPRQAATLSPGLAAPAAPPPGDGQVPGLSTFQQQALTAAGGRDVRVRADGDCLFHALLVANFERVAARLLDTSGGRPWLSGSLDTLRRAGIVSAVRDLTSPTADPATATALSEVVRGMRNHLADRMLDPQAFREPGAVWVSGPEGTTRQFYRDLNPAERGKRLDRLREPGAWDDPDDLSIFDHVALAAMLEFGGGVAVLHPDRVEWPGLDPADWPAAVDGPAALRDGALIYNGQDHYDAVPAPPPPQYAPQPSSPPPSYERPANADPDSPATGAAGTRNRGPGGFWPFRQVLEARPERARYTDVDLTHLIGQVVQDVPPRGDNCVELLLGVRDRLYGGVRGDRPVDDLSVDTRRGREQFAATGVWRRPVSMDAVTAAVAQVGSTAFLQFYRANEPGHAIVLHRSAEGLRLLDPANSSTPIHVTDAAQLAAFVRGAVGVRALVTGPTGTVVPDAFPQAAESESTLSGIVDPSHPRLGGGAVEIELPYVLRFPDRRPEGNETVVQGQHVKLVADGFTGDIPEIATVPTRILDHETWSDPDVVFHEVQQLWDRLRHRAQRGEVLGDGFASASGEPGGHGDGDRLTVAPEWQDVSVEHLKWQENAYVQYTVGVPVAGLYPFLRFVAQHPLAHSAERTSQGLDYLRDGLDFGVAMARELGASVGFGTVRSASDPVGHPSVTLAGVLALVYHHAAALSHRYRDIRDLFKNRVLALSRIDLDVLRAALPTEARALIEVAAPWLRARFVDFFTAHEPAHVDRISVASGGRRLLDTRLFGHGGATFTLGDYLDAALTGQPHTVVGHRAAFGMHTVLAELDPGGGQLPLVPLELRAFGRNLLGDTDAVRREYDLLAAEVRDQYQELVSGRDDGGDPFPAPGQPSRPEDPGTAAVLMADVVTAWGLAQRVAGTLREGGDLGAVVRLVMELPPATRVATWYAATTLAGVGDWRATPPAGAAVASDDRYWASVETVGDLLRGDRADRQMALRRLDRSHSPEVGVPSARSVRVVPGHRSWFSPADWSVNVAAELTDVNELAGALLAQIHQKARLVALLRSPLSTVSGLADPWKLTDIPLEIVRQLWLTHSPEPVRHTDENLLFLVDDVMREVPPGGDNGVDSFLVLRDRLYPETRDDRPFDGPGGDTRQDRDQFASPTAWPRPASLDEVADVVAAEVGRSAFLYFPQAGHPIVLHRSVDGPRVIDLANVDDPVTAYTTTAQLHALGSDALGVHALVTDPAGTVLPDAFRRATEPESRQTGAARHGQQADTAPQVWLQNLTPEVQDVVMADPLFQAMTASPHRAEIQRATAGAVLEAGFHNTATAVGLNQHLLTSVPNLAALLVVGETIAAGLDGNATRSGQARLRKVQQEFDAIRQQASRLLTESPDAPARWVGELVGRWHRGMEKLSSFDPATSEMRQLVSRTGSGRFGSLTRRATYQVVPGQRAVDVASYTRLLGTVLAPPATPSTGNLPAVQGDQVAGQASQAVRGGDRLIFQLGTNNWQRGGEFAPGSGILHEAHHHAYNALPGWRDYSMYPSQRQRFEEEDVKVFALDHPIPICESVSPSSNYRWHGMSEEEVAAYRRRLTDEVATWMDEIEARTGERFALAIAHHGFMNPVVMRDVIQRRAAAGRDPIPLLTFVHGTELKMYNNEQRGDRPDEFPQRFLPYIKGEKIFDYDDPTPGVDVVAAISEAQVQAFGEVFPEFPDDRVVFSQNGYNQDVFRPGTAYADRENVLASFTTQPVEGSGREPEPVAPADGFDAVVVFCGKFADWKRLDALLHAAARYEQGGPRILTLVVGGGPEADQRRMQDLAAELGLQRTYFLGPRQQDELATLFSVADVGVFPSRNEPFGLVFIECMATGTPVIGADSGGPRGFVTSDVGTLVPETDNERELADSLAAAVTRAVEEDWKATKGPTAAAYARENFSVVRQVSDLLEAVERLTAEPMSGPQPRGEADGPSPTPVPAPDQGPQTSEIRDGYARDLVTTLSALPEMTTADGSRYLDALRDAVERWKSGDLPSAPELTALVAATRTVAYLTGMDGSGTELFSHRDVADVLRGLHTLHGDASGRALEAVGDARTVLGRLRDDLTRLLGQRPQSADDIRAALASVELIDTELTTSAGATTTANT